MTLQDQASFYSVGSSEEWLVNQCLGDPKQTIHPGAQSSFLSSIDRTEESAMHPSLFDGATTPTENGCSLHPRTGNKVSPSMSPIEQNSPISQKKEDDEAFGAQGPPSPPQNGKGKLHPSTNDGQSRQKDSDPSQPEPTYRVISRFGDARWCLSDLGADRRVVAHGTSGTELRKIELPMSDGPNRSCVVVDMISYKHLYHGFALYGNESSRSLYKFLQIDGPSQRSQEPLECERQT